MTSTTIISLSLAFIFALGFSFFQYLLKKEKRNKDNYVLFALRFLSLFTLLLLLINPKISSTTYTEEKPNLVLAIDNSASIKELKLQDSMQKIIKFFKNDKELSKRFQIHEVAFSEDIGSESPSFNATQTNIYNALQSLQKTYRKNNTALVLLSDGNQTTGREYQYFKTHANIRLFPIVLGDTTKFPDLQVSRLNANHYAFLNNNFPLEVFLNYSGEQRVNAQFRITRNGKSVYSKDVQFNPDKTSEIIQANLPANPLGLSKYKAEIIPLNFEKNTQNNYKNFAIEVIDERSNILLLTKISHPDIGAFKQAIESNTQRKLSIKNIEDNNTISDYQLVILYQPDKSFKQAVNKLKSGQQNVFWITGSKTDWNFVNNNQNFVQKKITLQRQDIFAEPNANFSQFQFVAPNFENFPPLEDSFGTISKKNNQLNSVLQQKIEGVSTTQPLLSIASGPNRKVGFLFGENIWRWRAKSYLNTGSFQVFDDFIGAIMQNLSKTKKRERLQLDFQSFYYENEEINIRAQYFDENYQFDARAQLNLIVKDSLGKSTNIAFVPQENEYQANLGNLLPGTYSFRVNAGQGISKSGSFEVLAYAPEKQFTSANLDKMRVLASNNESKIYFSSTLKKLSQLLKSEDFVTIQKMQKKKVSLLNWVYLLYFLVALLAAEWFFRKYKGLI